MKKPYAIIIMDGYGISKEREGNAIALEGSPNVKKSEAEYPSSQLGASGMSVGLPDGQMGNSEVGHMNMGAGRIVYQELTKITKEIQDGGFFRNEALLAAINSAKENGKKLHIWGLLSDGGVHSHITHLFALLELCKAQGLENAYVHCFMDGRDVSPTSGAGFARQLQAKMDELSFGSIASVCGRYYAMDRDNRWERVVKAYGMLTLGNGIQAENAADALEQSYKDGVTDEFVLPTNIVKGGRPVALVEEGDSVIFFNFRPDRAREITRAFTEPSFDGFERKTGDLRARICLLHAVRRHLLARPRRLPAAEPEKHPRRIPLRPRQKAAAHRRNGEVCARHLLLQRRRRGAQPRGRPRARPFPEGRHL